MTLGGSGLGLFLAFAQDNNATLPRDVVTEGQRMQSARFSRVEQKKNTHDSSDIFAAPNAKPSAVASAADKALTRHDSRKEHHV